MKTNVFRMLRSGICLVLALCMVLGMCPVTAFATESGVEIGTAIPEPEDYKIIKYVSLGDSMTNGYGLTKYDNNGFETYGRESYAVQFSDWLVENGYADEVVHYEYALSAMRAEDLHFVLEYPIDDPEAAEIADGEWNEEAWETKFKAGDWYTWDEHANNGRFWQNVRKYQGDMIGSTNDAAKKYQTAVAEADIVSIGLGNSNWGVFLLGRIMNALGFMGGSYENDSWIELEDALRDDCPPEIADKIMDYATKVRAELVKNETLTSKLSVEKVDALANAMIYTLVSYVLNYGGAVDRIVELNPDAEIMIVGLMNTMKGMEFRVDENTVVDMGEYMYEALNIANIYLAALPTYMQANGHWAEATFFYAEAPNVEVMVDKYADYIKDPNFPTIRDRFITEIVGDDGNAMVWNMLKPMVSGIVSGASLVPITREDVELYEAMSEADKATYAASTASDNPQRNTAISCAIYLAFEDAVVASCDPENDAVMSIEGMLALQNLDAGVFANVVTYFGEHIGENGADMILDAATPVADLASQANPALTKEILALMTANVTTDEDGNEIRETGYAAAAAALVKPDFAESEMAKNVAALNHDGDMDALLNAKGECDHAECAAVYAQFDALVAEYAGQLAAADGTYNLIGNVQMLCMLLALPETLSAGLQSDEMIFGLLNLYARCLIGNGLGAHPSGGGHDTLTAAVTKAYGENETAFDKTYQEAYDAMAALYEYLRNYVIENGAEAALKDAYEYAQKLGLDKVLEDMLEQLKAEIENYIENAAPVEEALAQLTKEAEALEEELKALKAQLEEKLAELEEQMANAAGEVNEDALATIEATKAAIATIEKAIAETEAALLEVNEGIEACIATLDDLEKAIRYLDNRVVELDGKIAELYSVLTSGSEDSIESVAEVVKGIRDTIESTINLVQTTYESAAELAETVAELSVKAAEATYAAAENALAILEELDVNMEAYTEAAIKALEEKYAEEIALLENNKELILAAGALAAQVVYDRENAPDGAITALKQQIEVAGEKKAELEAELKELEAKVEAEAQAAYDKAVAEAEVAYNMTLAHIEEKLPIVQAELAEKVAALKEMGAEAYAVAAPIVAAAIPVIENILANSGTVSEMIYAAAEAVAGEALQLIENAIDQVIDAWNKAYNSAVTGAYLLNSDSYYVALGDSAAYGEKTYVDELAAELELANYKNLSSDKNNVLAQMEALATDKALQAEVAKADLITIGFSQVPMMNDIVNTLVDAFAGQAQSPDWAKFVGEENVRYIAAIRDEIFEGLTVYLDEPMDDYTAALVTAAIESYAYGIVAYTCVIPEMVNAIHEINPYAVVALVGLYNPIDGVALDFGTGDALELGEFVEYVVEGAQIHGTAYSMITGNSFYVNAPAVETLNTDDNLNIADLLKLYQSECAVLNPNANGHDYIQKCIYEALGLSNPAVVRVFGEDRYETALAAADTMLAVTGAEKFETVVVATGREFADALAGSYLAAEMDAPILLIKDSKADLVANYIAENLVANGTIYVLGGEAAVSAATFAKLEKVGTAVRLEGENRYETNLAILTEAGANGGELLIATGKNYADALSASSTGLPVMLVSSSLKAEQKDYLANAGFSKLTILGGVNAVSEELANELAAYGNVDRIAGETRYETSAAIANHYFGGRNGSVVVASGRDFPDALCGGALAAAAGIPVVMTKHGGIEAADNYAVKAALGVVLGGEATGITKQDIVDIFELLSADDIEYVQY